MSKLAGKEAVVTGSGRGIRAAIATRARPRRRDAPPRRATFACEPRAAAAAARPSWWTRRVRRSSDSTVRSRSAAISTARPPTRRGRAPSRS